jgi:hypothetical protein
VGDIHITRLQEDTMTSTPHPGQSAGVDVAASSSRLPYVALILGILSVPGSILTWDSGLPGEGFVWGLPVAVAAVVVGVTALRGRAAPRWAAYVGLVLGAAMTLMVVLWTALGA